MTNLNNTTTLISFKTGVISEYKGTTWLNQLHKNIEADKIFKQPEIKYPHIEYHKTIWITSEKYCSGFPELRQNKIPRLFPDFSR